jgi:hypothetical protein
MVGLTYLPIRLTLSKELVSGNIAVSTESTHRRQKPFLDPNSRMGRDQPAINVFRVKVKRGSAVVGQDICVADCGCVGGEEREEVLGCLDERAVG